jgi:chorismate-pyruvate lyase
MPSGATESGGGCLSSIDGVALPPALAAAVYPLNEFYRRSGVPLPRFELIAGQDVPEPWRRLLVHDRDMTPTLEDHHADDIHIEVLGRERQGDAYFREVILRLDRNDRPVEFGANRIALDLLPSVVRRLVLQEQLPFGHILKAHEVLHTGAPDAFFRVEADPLMSRAFGLAGCDVLYGRHNTLRDLQGRAISEVVEILPP